MDFIKMLREDKKMERLRRKQNAINITFECTFSAETQI